MTTAISDTGVQFAGGNIINIASTYPTTGSYTQGDIVLEKNTSTQYSGWKRLTTGSNNVLGTDWLYFSGLTLSTAVATTSGTAIDFTGIPSWVKRITVMFNGVSTSGTSLPQIQIGTSGGVQITGYSGVANQTFAGTTVVSAMSSGFLLQGSTAATNLMYGLATICLLDNSNGTWAMNACTGIVSGAVDSAGGSKTLSGTLDRVRITTVNGTDTFDAGSINIMYEG